MDKKFWIIRKINSTFIAIVLKILNIERFFDVYSGPIDSAYTQKVFIEIKLQYTFVARAKQHNKIKV